jgi:hypothetical protein
MHKGFVGGVNTGKILVTDYTHDGLHPTTWGHQMKAHMAEAALIAVREKIKSASADELKVKPVPKDMLYGDAFTNLQTIDEKNNLDKIVSYGSWEMAKNPIVDDQYTTVFKHNGGSDAFVFKMTGSELYIHSFGAGYDEEGNGEAVILEITIDGNIKIETACEDNPNLITDQLSEGEHTVSITVKNPNPNDPFEFYLINYQ